MNIVASMALAGRAVCVAFHPGWVQTDMRGTLARLTAPDNGTFLNHDGARLDW